MGTCTGTAFRGRSAHQDVDPAALRRPEEADAVPGRADAGQGAVGGRGASARFGSDTWWRYRRRRAAGPGPVGAVRDGLGVAAPRPGAPTRTAAEATVSNDTLTLSCGFLPLHLEHSFP